jgi:hypothetical protein
VGNIVARVSHTLRQKAMNLAGRQASTRTATSQVADALVKHIKQFESLSALTGAAQQIIRDYTMNPEYAFLYLRAVQATERP